MVNVFLKNESEKVKLWELDKVKRDLALSVAVLHNYLSVGRNEGGKWRLQKWREKGDRIEVLELP